MVWQVETHLCTGEEGGEGRCMNIETFAVVKCWVMNKTSTPRASSMVPEPRWHAGCPRRVGLGGMHALPHRRACQVRALGLAEMLQD